MSHPDKLEFVDFFVFFISDALPHRLALLQASDFLFLPYPMLCRTVLGHFRHRDFCSFTFRCLDAKQLAKPEFITLFCIEIHPGFGYIRGCVGL